MYKIIKDNITLGFIESPNFIKKLDNGCYGLTSADKATGINYDGTVYNLMGREPLDEGLETVMAMECDAGAMLNEQNAQINAANEELTSVEMALCDMYEDRLQTIAI